MGDDRRHHSLPFERNFTGARNPPAARLGCETGVRRKEPQRTACVAGIRRGWASASHGERTTDWRSGGGGGARPSQHRHRGRAAAAPRWGRNRRCARERRETRRSCGRICPRSLRISLSSEAPLLACAYATGDYRRKEGYPCLAHH
jgi:hypothetical protein